MRQIAYLRTTKSNTYKFGEAFDFTGADFARWCREAGFKRTQIIPLAGQASWEKL